MRKLNILICCLGDWENDPRVVRSVEAALIKNAEVCVLETGHRTLSRIGRQPYGVKLIQLYLSNFSKAIKSNIAHKFFQLINSVTSSTIKFLNWKLYLNILLSIFLTNLYIFQNFVNLNSFLLKPAIFILFSLFFINFLTVAIIYLKQKLIIYVDFPEHSNRLKKTIIHLDKHRYDAVYIHDLKPLIFLSEALSKCKVSTKVIWDAHEYYLDTGNLTESQQIKVRELINELPTPINTFVTVNEFIADLYLKNFHNIPVAKVVYNSARLISPVNYDGRLHESAGLNLDRKILLFQGGFGQFRGIDLLLNIADKIPENWSIVFMGEGPLDKNITNRIDELESQFGYSNVRIIPKVHHKELLHFTAGASVGNILYQGHFLNHHLASPNKIWEYAAVGVPFIASNTKFLKKSVSENQIGWVIEQENASQKIINILSTLDENKLSRLRSNCLKFSNRINWISEREKISNLF